MAIEGTRFYPMNREGADHRQFKEDLQRACAGLGLDSGSSGQVKAMFITKESAFVLNMDGVDPAKADSLKERLGSYSSPEAKAMSDVLASDRKADRAGLAEAAIGRPVSMSKGGTEGLSDMIMAAASRGAGAGR